MSLPVITLLSLLFMAVSQGVYFASRAAVWNPIGAIADLLYMGLFAAGIRVPEYIEKIKMEMKTKIIGEKIREICPVFYLDLQDTSSLFDL